MDTQFLLLIAALFWFSTSAQIINRINHQLFENDQCPLTNGETGICRKTSECRSSDRQRELHCEWSKNDPVICCAESHTDNYDALANRADGVCEGIPEFKSGGLRDHVVGKAEHAAVGEFPFMALLRYQQENVRCGAALLNEKFFITAAHCFKFFDPIAVVTGIDDATDALADSYPISRIIKHKDYDPRTKQNDIALVEVEKPVKLNQNVQPICLYTRSIDLPVTTILTIMGWGQDNTDNSSNQLLKGAVRPVLRSACQTNYTLPKRSVKLSENQLCAQGFETENGVLTDACQGDSGGPLVLEEKSKFHLVGIVSYGAACGTERFPGIYTRISSYLDWIIDIAWKES
ncbi:transmembrane protease serine 9-like [Uranotaenia lowii]|uniref:transmembrane protease serine 9-like n=1 Tax=Uranotaenia lowii TaxID=190385 RepID=UPI00247A33BF|nr:transmembrane protease serine 9-like [Uranotaenia lowii]